MSLDQKISHWRALLGREQTKLQHLNKSSEQEFLALGQHLQTFYVKAKALAERAKSITTQLGAGDISASTDGLQRLFEEMSASLDKSEALTRQCEEFLAQIKENILEISRPLNQFDKIIQTLHILGISTRIENARLDESKSDFNLLSGEVEDLASDIHAKADNIICQANSVVELVSRTRADMLALEVQRQRQAREILGATEADLRCLITKRHASSGIVDDIMRAASDIFEHASAVISSMQFNDITRQQVEHVIEAIGELQDLSKPGVCEKTLEGPDAGWLVKMRDICLLQRAQADHAKQSLTGAVEKVFDNLRAIAAATTEFSAKISEVTCSESNGKSSFLQEMGADIERISDSLSENSRTNKQMAKSIKAVTTTVSEMAGFLNDIHNIGFEIEMIAVNAIVKASNIGSGGVALTVLAESIKALSENTRGIIDVISEKLRQVTLAAGELQRTIDDDTRGRTSEFRNISKELHELLTHLRDIDSNITAELSGLDDNAGELAEEIRGRIDGFTTHGTFATAMEQAKGVFAEIAAATDTLLPAQHGGQMTANQAALRTRYTMESERTIHEKVMRTKHQPINVVTDTNISVADGPDETGEFGENVELF